MGYIFASLFAVVIVGLILWIFVNSDAKVISQSFKLIIPVSLLTFGIIATITGKGQYGIPAIVGACAWWYFGIRKR